MVHASMIKRIMKYRTIVGTFAVLLLAVVDTTFSEDTHATCGAVKLGHNILMKASGNKPYKTGVRLTFRCTSGFRSVEKLQIRCLADGRWSGPVPLCQELSTRSRCQRVVSKVEDDRTCQPSCERFRCEGDMQCLCDGWCGKSCIDPGSECPSIIQPKNTEVKGENRTYGSEVVFTCLTGYKITSNETLKCRSDRKWSGTTPHCEDIDECEGYPCGQNAECWNSQGSYLCTCHEGYSGQDNICEDIDECMDDPNICNNNAECWNFVGNYSCECKSGYTGDGITCQALTCQPPGLIENGRYSPLKKDYAVGERIKYTCNTGYKLDGADFAVCDESSLKFDVSNCIDINECEETVASCGENAECWNSVGKYSCECAEGYTGDGMDCKGLGCQPPPEVKNGRFYPQKSAYIEGEKIHYSCNKGFELVGKIAATCVSPSMEFAMSDCIDIDECKSDAGDCDQNARCRNIPGSYSCQCNDGYTGDGKTCKAARCQPPPQLVNGKYLPVKLGYDVGEKIRYSCDEGYKLDGKVISRCLKSSLEFELSSCIDQDECKSDPNKCDQNASCRNSLGSFSCECKDGYTGDGKTCKAKIKECKTPAKIQHGRYSPIKLKYHPGDRIRHTCNKGYRINGNPLAKCDEDVPEFDSPKCIDIDECEVMPKICGRNAECRNSPGHYVCECKDGYVGDGKTCRMDIKKCETPPEISHARYIPSKATYHVGDWVKYICSRGFQVNGTSSTRCDEDTLKFKGPMCVDINECDAKIKPCDKYADCLNSIGTYTCRCKQGYVANGKECKDIDECIDASSRCHKYSTCKNTPGSYQCRCNDGYRGNGKTCADLNECISAPKSCDQNAICRNTLGSYTCQCKIGYIGDGKNCRAVIRECKPPFHIISGGFRPVKVKYYTNDQITYFCYSGFKLNGSSEAKCEHRNLAFETPTCIDIDECAGASICSTYASCQNTQGSYQCICKNGYNGDGLTCSKIPLHEPGAAWAEWSAWTCSATCGGGNGHRVRACRRRGAVVGHHECDSRSNWVQRGTCNTSPCESATATPIQSIPPTVTNEWGPWSSCNVTCGAGSATRKIRLCYRNGVQVSSGPCHSVYEANQGRSCNMPQCQGQASSGSSTPSPADIEWGPWTPCSVTCGTGTATRRRRICERNGVRVSSGPCHRVFGPDEDKFCNMPKCGSSNSGPFFSPQQFQNEYMWSDWTNEARPCYDRYTGTCKRERLFARTCTVKANHRAGPGGGCVYNDRQQKMESCSQYECDISRVIMNIQRGR